MNRSAVNRSARRPRFERLFASDSTGVSRIPTAVRRKPGLLFLCAVLMAIVVLDSIAALAGDQMLVAPFSHAAFEAAVLKGGTVVFGDHAVIRLTNTVILSRNTTIDGNGWMVQIDAQNRSRHFLVANGVTARLKGLELLNGSYYAPSATNGPGPPGLGGSIYTDGGSLELVDCLFRDNMTMGGNGALPAGVVRSANGGDAGGGAVYCANGTLNVVNSSFLFNRATGGYAAFGASSTSTHTGGASFGGALYLTNSALALVRGSFSNNFAAGGVSAGDWPPTPGGKAAGGALALKQGTGSIKQCRFVANFVQAPQAGAAFGGAFYHNGGDASIDESVFAANRAQGGEASGGGPEIVYGGSAFGGAVVNEAGGVRILNSALVLNLAKGGDAGFSPFTPARSGNGEGGAIFDRAELELINCTLSENEAAAGKTELPWAGVGEAHGGALSGKAACLHVTFARNRISQDSAGRGSGSSIFGEATLTNSILACSAGQTNVSGSITDGGHNICSDHSAAFSSPNSLNGVDPLLGPLADNGGFTPTVALLARSPAVNAADPNAALSADQRGVRRPTGAGSDIGAFELAPVLSLQPGSPGTRVFCLFEPNKSNHFFVSTDLKQWREFGAAWSNADGQAEAGDPEWSGQAPRFYRAEVEYPSPPR